MQPLPAGEAEDFWAASPASAGRGERVIPGTYDGNLLIATVALQLACPPNQPHRAEIAKLMTRPSRRGRGTAKSLMRAAERIAVEREKALLALDTATRIYWKRIGKNTST